MPKTCKLGVDMTETKLNCLNTEWNLVTAICKSPPYIASKVWRGVTCPWITSHLVAQGATENSVGLVLVSAWFESTGYWLAFCMNSYIWYVWNNISFHLQLLPLFSFPSFSSNIDLSLVYFLVEHHVAISEDGQSNGGLIFSLSR